MNIPNALDDGTHGSSAQKSIWHCQRKLAPLMPAQTEGDALFSTQQYADGQEQFYRCMTSLYAGMYANPDAYAIPAAPYDDYMRSRPEPQHTGAENGHQTDAKESTLRNAFKQAIEFYPNYFFKVGVAAARLGGDGALVMPQSAYGAALKALDKPHIVKQNARRTDALLEGGLLVRTVGGEVHVSHSAYPLMGLGLWLLCRAPESKYKYMNYLRLDYQGRTRGAPGIEDILRTLDDGHAAVVEALRSALESEQLALRVKPLGSITAGHPWKAEFTRGGKNVAGFYAEPGYLRLCLYFGSTKNIEAVAAALEHTDAALFDWLCGGLPERLCSCPNNKTVMLGDEARRICGMSNSAQIVDPQMGDVDMLLRVMDVYRGLMS